MLVFFDLYEVKTKKVMIFARCGSPRGHSHDHKIGKTRRTISSQWKLNCQTYKLSVGY
jgi:hypothetical protein